MLAIRVGESYRGWFIHCHPYVLDTGRFRGVRWGQGVGAESLQLLQGKIDQKIITMQQELQRNTDS